MPFKDSCPDKVVPDWEVLVGGDIKYLTQSSHPHDIVDLFQTTVYGGEVRKKRSLITQSSSEV